MELRFRDSQSEWPLLNRGLPKERLRVQESATSVSRKDIWLENALKLETMATRIRKENLEAPWSATNVRKKAIWLETALERKRRWKLSLQGHPKDADPLDEDRPQAALARPPEEDLLSRLKNLANLTLKSNEKHLPLMRKFSPWKRSEILGNIARIDPPFIRKVLADPTANLELASNANKRATSPMPAPTVLPTTTGPRGKDSPTTPTKS
jgi:hypothetical protein